jgi:glycosyltransferase involved in cell wall biosynthesis
MAGNAGKAAKAALKSPVKGALFDARWVRPGMTGVGQYALNILRSPAIPRDRCGVILARDCPFPEAFDGYRIFRPGVDIMSHPATEAYEQFIIPWLCLRHGYGSFLSFEGRVPAFHPGVRTYSVIYDLTYAQAKGSHPMKYAVFMGMHAGLSRRFATGIVTISETVRRDIVRVLGMPEAKVHVAYPAGSRLRDHVPVPVAGLEKPFFLSVGITNPRKNLAAILKGFAEARIHPGLESGLAVTGNAGLAVTGNAGLIAAQGRDIPLDGVRNLGFVEAGELRWLYENASALVYASRHEGFGIPLVDAAEFGCPVLCSDIPVFREVMGGSARYFDPDAPASIASAMRSALAGSRPRGTERADASGAAELPNASRVDALGGKFSWDASARGLAAWMGIA